MGSDYIKNLRIDIKNNMMTADIADMKSYPITFDNVELYKKKESFEEKYSALIFDIVSGMLHFTNSSHKLAKLGFGEKTAVELKNYYDDYRVLGSIGVYKKYENKINQILNNGIEGRKLEIIPSEVELHYKMETLPNRSFKDISKLFYSLESITENNSLSIREKKHLYEEMINKELSEEDRKKPLFIQYNKDNPDIIVSVYPIIKKNTYKDDVFLTYYFDIKNLKTNYEKIYDDIGMMISYILDDELMTKQVLHGMEQQFIEDERKEKNKYIEEENCELL
ncbi:hypothetical protein [uncultured Clostridium sp.]|uniref:hypothetical protein n=1 Tax=uncultured Clostridium sp. TaxID=59620 RepID=UPI002729CADE|nr:hypothetical protein [uncultured Clostridium sp.]